MTEVTTGSGKNVINATIITIGDELLIGQVVDTNSAFLGSELGKMGISLRRKTAVGDRAEEIIRALDEAARISEIILITGGLGPTKDDITKTTLATYFNSGWKLHPDILEMVRSVFKRINRPMPEMNVSQAELPDNCVPIKNYYGTAPGMWFERDGKVFVSMPGVPFEMKPMFTDSVGPLLKEKFNTPFILHRSIHTQGIGESALAEKIADIEDSFPENIRLAYLPHYSIVRLRISATGNDEYLLRRQVAGFEKQIVARVGDSVFGYDDTSLAKEMGILLKSQGKTMATAESCTGGLVAHKVCLVPGASDYFAGSIVSYSYQLKEQLLGVNPETLKTHGAVSEQTVCEMLDGLLRQTRSDYGIAISGIAGPGGATPDKPVGTVWIAVGDRKNKIAKRFQFTRSREIIMEYTAITALAMLWRFIRDAA